MSPSAPPLDTSCTQMLTLVETEPRRVQDQGVRTALCTSAPPLDVPCPRVLSLIIKGPEPPLRCSTHPLSSSLPGWRQAGWHSHT